MNTDTGHTESAPLQIEGVTFTVDRDNDLCIEIDAREYSVTRWLAPSQGQRLLEFLQAWLRDKPDEQQLNSEKE